MKQAKTSLEELQKRPKRLEDAYHIALSAMSDGIYTVDRDLRIVTVDKLPVLWVKRRHENLIGRLLPEAFPFLPQRTYDQYREVFESGRTTVTEETIIVDQKNRSVETRMIPVSEDGQVTKVFTVLKDITETKQAKSALVSERDTLRSMIDVMPFGVTLLDRQRTVLSQNAGVTRIFGECKGKKCYKSYESNGEVCEECPVKRSFEDGIFHKTERKVTTPTGQSAVFENTAIPIRDSSGAITSCLEIVKDITKHKRGEESLREIRDLTRRLFETSPMPQAVMDPKSGRFVRCNEAAVRIYGYENREKLLDKTPLQMSTPTQYDGIASPIAAEKHIEACWRDGIHCFEWRHQRPNNQIWDADIHMMVFRHHGRPYIWFALRDITEYRRALNTLSESAQRYRDLVESTSDFIWEVDQNGSYTYASPKVRDILGYEPEEVIGKTPLDFMEEDEAKRVAGLFAAFAESCEPIQALENIGLHKDGEKVVLETNGVPIFDRKGAFGGYRGIDRDITGRKASEKALLTAQVRLSQAMDLAGIVYWEHDLSTGKMMFNDSFYALYGTTAKQEGGYQMTSDEAVDRFVHPEDAALVRRARQDLLASSDGLRSSKGFEHRIIRRDGEIRHIMTRSKAERDTSGRIVKVYGANQDITARIRGEEALRKSEEMYRSLIAASPDAISVIDRSGQVVLGSPKTLELFGVEKDHGLGRSIIEWVAPEDRPRAEAAIRQLLTTGYVPFGEFALKKEDGTLFDAEVHAAPIRLPDGTINGGILITRDMTDRKNLQAQLLQAQKMEAIGTLAGGVAHDFNNILTAIMGYSGFIQNKMPKADPLRTYLQEINNCASKAANVTRSLLAFSRKQSMELQPCSSNMILRDIEKLLRRLVPEDVDLTLALKEDVVIMVDVTQIGQVLMNLISNAKDAMPKGGALHVETKGTELGTEFGETHGFGAPGQYVMISVTDTGCGMDEATQKKIFEPFFTTKEVGKGTGLGLSIVYGIIKQHNGYVTVSSQPGKGTTFDIYLPAVKMNISQTKQAIVPAQGGTETILLAEDEDHVRQVVNEMLRMSGYTIIQATDGEDAVRQYKKHRDKIDLLILDVVMPGKNGKEVCDEIRTMNTSVPAIFMSGYTGDVVLDKGIPDIASNYISKPIIVDDLLKKIRETLER
jgi:two-component system, cell cycle sensor histidine kinase and response regulator CckA